MPRDNTDVVPIPNSPTRRVGEMLKKQGVVAKSAIAALGISPNAVITYLRRAGFQIETQRGGPKRETLFNYKGQTDQPTYVDSYAPRRGLRSGVVQKPAWKMREERGAASRAQKHWTQTPEGRAKQSAHMKAKWEKGEFGPRGPRYSKPTKGNNLVDLDSYEKSLTEALEHVRALKELRGRIDS